MFFAVKDLRKWFGGVKAVNGVTLHVNQGEICSVIGPNGAGKTTLFNLITGFIKPDSGEVTFLDEPITGKHPKVITEKGIARSFQIVKIFPRLTVYENVMVAVLAQQGKSWDFLGRAKKYSREECEQLLKSIGLSGESRRLAGQLSHGNQKRLEVGLALAMKPKLLLLDEPTAGMAVEEKAGVLATVRQMTKEQGCTIFLCEHDMRVIFEVSDTVWVVHNGQVVTQGTVAEIRGNDTVRKIYLGEKN
jgi:branched-chain amino acid transport system ATP-binding protein